MSYTLKKLIKPSAGAGAPTTGNRFAFLLPVDNAVSFPDTDANNVMLNGQPVYKEGTALVPIYITNSSQEYSYESQGDQDARSHKVKFIGTHPGTEREALEFAQNNLDKEFIIFIPGCQSTDNVKVLGRPCAPLIFKSNHKSGKDGSKFEFTFEQEIGSKYIYFLYNGPLVTQDMVYTEVDFTTALTGLSVVQKVKNTVAAQALKITSLEGNQQNQVTFIGQEKDAAKAGTISEDLAGLKVMIITKDGLQWKAIEGSTITFEVYSTASKIVLIERWRT
ncbi:DUF1398 domain-containing protein [Chryseobacterium vrystaatense]|uniref:Uncharacterized protein n=1 Tax=Chryseobacterium vrystaatense TaxID=307480 RepID=A0ABR4UP36_9FLAO|nr:hypothetical protein [Chryseobacterium vrystaatense]KFF26867.1 hypothetical protein IW16_06200 [Chryseobacterium vrystaatense]